MSKLKTKDVRSYSVYGLWAAWLKWSNDDPTKEEVIQWYLELHPEADEAAVRAEMEAEINRYER